jgi:hypothetical protein
VFGRPSCQDEVNRGSRWRSVPDVTMDAQAGPSESAPMVAGVLALATQLNDGRNLGPINPVRYDILGPLGTHAGGRYEGDWPASGSRPALAAPPP